MVYLIGEGEFSAFDKSLLHRIEDTEKPADNTRPHSFFVIDNVAQKAMKVFAH